MPFDQAQRLPSLLATFDTILIAEREGIGEGAHGRLETDAVLFRLLAALAGCQEKRIDGMTGI